MSELRDLTSAMRALSAYMGSITDCMVVLVRDSQQQTKWRHDQKNLAVIEEGRWDGQERAMLQIQNNMAALSTRVVEVHDELRTLQTIRFEDVKELKDRLRKREEAESFEEVTK